MGVSTGISFFQNAPVAWHHDIAPSGELEICHCAGHQCGTPTISMVKDRSKIQKKPHEK
jgi:hypothetical protein